MTPSPQNARSHNRPPAGRLRTCLRRIGALVQTARLPRSSSVLGRADLAGILDLLEEHLYTGEVTADGRFVAHWSGPALQRLVGGPLLPGAAAGNLWESLVHPEDRPGYEAFNRTLLTEREAELTYRLIGLDGETRILWERARSRSRADGSALVHGIISDITAREEANARLAEAGDRLGSLLDIVGEYAYVVLAHPDGRVEELFHSPGADRLLGGAGSAADLRNWDAAVHPEDREAYQAYTGRLMAGHASELEYRLIGADAVTRWVHDRAASRRRQDGTLEISGMTADITERRRLRAELDATHAALSRVVQAMDDHLYTLRVAADGTVRPVYRGPNREEMMGGPATGGEEDDRRWVSLLHPEDRERWRAALAQLVDGEPHDGEYRLIGLDGVERVVFNQLRPRRDADGTLFYDGVTRDITERRRLETELRRSVAEMEAAHRELEAARAVAETRACTDELTGVFNRRRFAEVVADALADTTSGFGLLLLDADHFKQVNDTHGHAVGDEVLVELARRLRRAMRPGDCLARWGGEEFVVLLEGVASEEALELRAQRLCAAVGGTPVTVGSVSVTLTVSIGATLAGDGRDSLDALIDSADRCLYAAKRRGRDRVSLVADVVDDSPPAPLRDAA